MQCESMMLGMTGIEFEVVDPPEKCEKGGKYVIESPGAKSSAVTQFMDCVDLKREHGAMQKCEQKSESN